MRRFLLCLSLSLFCIISSQAQRLIPHQRAIELSVGTPVIKGKQLFQKEQMTAALSLMQYFRQGNYAFLSAEYGQENYHYRASLVPCKDYLLQLGYMHALLSDKGKNIFFYLGASAVGGYEELNENNAFLYNGAKLLDKSNFVYGSALHSSIELFLTDNIVLSLKGQARLIFGTDLNRLRPALALGLRFNL